MKKKTSEELRRFLEKLEKPGITVSNRVIEKVRQDYLARLQRNSQVGSVNSSIDPALKRMFENLADLMEEILLRVYIGEFDKEELFSGIFQLNLFSDISELVKLFHDLERFKSSIEDLTTGAGIALAEPVESGKIDVDTILSDFDEIDIFEEYREGDELYDTQYEEEDRWVLSELFLMIMDGYIEPIAVGIRSVLNGNASPRLFKALLASLLPLQRSAETMGFEQLADALSQLEDVIKLALSEGINAKTRILLAKSYSMLKKNLPDSEKSVAFMDILDSNAAESSFILSLINSKNVEEWMIQALIEFGIHSREQLMVASVNELSVVTGLSYEKSRLIIERCRNSIMNTHTR